MNLDELKKIDSDAKSLGYKVSELKRAQNGLQGLRVGPHATIEEVLAVFNRWTYGGEKIAKEEFFAVLSEQMASAMRIAELRLEAQARACSAEENLLRAQLAAYFGEEKPAAEVVA